MDDKPYVGVYVDHRQAMLFWADEEANIELQQIKSEYQEEGEPTDRVKRDGRDIYGGGVEHARLEQRRAEQLKRYYKKLDRALRPAEQILLFGPGEAKRELARKLGEDKGLRASLREVKNVDSRTTTPQKKAFVREFFELPRLP